MSRTQAPRTQVERSQATRLALEAAARRLWAERGYAEVGTSEIARAANVTRGAMYHQYADKTALFRAVVEAVEGEVLERLAVTVQSAGASSPAEALRAAADGWLTLAREPEVRQLLLLDAPTVLGWAGFRELSHRYALGLTEAMLAAALDAGELRPQPIRPLAAMLLGALDEAAMYLVHAEDPVREAEEVRTVVHGLLDGLLRPPRHAPKGSS